MATSQTTLTRRDTLNLRIKPEHRGPIDRAATLTGNIRTDCVREAVRRTMQTVPPRE